MSLFSGNRKIFPVIHRADCVQACSKVTSCAGTAHFNQNPIFSNRATTQPTRKADSRFLDFEPLIRSQLRLGFEVNKLLSPDGLVVSFLQCAATIAVTAAKVAESW